MTRKTLLYLIAIVLFIVGFVAGVVFPALPLPAHKGECRMGMSTFYTSGKLCVMGRVYYDINRLLVESDDQCRCYIVPANVKAIFRIK